MFKIHHILPLIRYTIPSPPIPSLPDPAHLLIVHHSQSRTCSSQFGVEVSPLRLPLFPLEWFANRSNACVVLLEVLLPLVGSLLHKLAAQNDIQFGFVVSELAFFAEGSFVMLEGQASHHFCVELGLQIANCEVPFLAPEDGVVWSPALEDVASPPLADHPCLLRRYVERPKISDHLHDRHLLLEGGLRPSPLVKHLQD